MQVSQKRYGDDEKRSIVLTFGTMPTRPFPTGYRHIVKRLVSARMRAGLTVDEVDAKLSRPAGYCAEWEAEVRAIDPLTLMEFAVLTGVPHDWLLNGGKLITPHLPVHTVNEAIQVAGPKEASVNKKNWSESFSRALAIVFANAMRPDFDGITPYADGRGQERLARTNRGYKKLDVGYSTEELGLALGVSLKSINFRDPGSDRYTKNYSRNDNELRAEAMDYHSRQPYAVLAGILMLPIDSCDDGDQDTQSESSFAAAVKYFRRRSNRQPPDGDADLFELFFIGLYDQSSPDGSNDFFFDVSDAPPKNGRPRRRPYSEPEPSYLDLSLSEVVERIKGRYDSINSYYFSYSDA